MAKNLETSHAERSNFTLPAHALAIFSFRIVATRVRTKMYNRVIVIYNVVIYILRTITVKL